MKIYAILRVLAIQNILMKIQTNFRQVIHPYQKTPKKM